MNKVQAKRLMFITLGTAYIGLTTFGMISGKLVPSEFISLVSGVFGYYFGYGKGEQSKIEK